MRPNTASSAAMNLTIPAGGEKSPYPSVVKVTTLKYRLSVQVISSAPFRPNK